MKKIYTVRRDYENTRFFETPEKAVVYALGAKRLDESLLKVLDAGQWVKACKEAMPLADSPAFIGPSECRVAIYKVM